MTRLMAMTLAAMLPLCAAAQDAEPPVEQEQQQPAEPQAILAQAYWPGQDLSNTFFRVFSDAALREVIDVFRAAGPDGLALLLLPPGQYWIMAVVDVNDNSVPDTGDGIGFYGVNEISAEARPTPLEVAAGKADSITIPILVRLNDQMRMEPLPWTQAGLPGIVTGAVPELREHGGVVVLLPVEGDGVPTAAPLDAEGGFTVTALAGSYRLIAASGADAAVAVGGSDEEPIIVAADAELHLGAIAISEGPLPADAPALMAGRVTGTPAAQEGGRTTIALFADEAMQQQVLVLEATPEGRFAAVLAPGSYYLRAIVDRDGDDLLSVGDLLGFHGVTDLMSEERPAPLEIAEGTLLTNVEIAISASINEEGRLSPWQPADDAPAAEPVNEPGE